MFIPYKVDVPMARWPIANFALIGVTCVVSLLMMIPLSDVSYYDEGVVDYFLLQPGNFRVSQLVGSVLIHGGLFHLVGNMVFLFVFGNAVNAKLGNARYLILYFAVAVIEGLVWVAIGPGKPALGASGAIMGVLGAYLILYPSNEVSVGYWWWFTISGVLEIAGGWLIALYVAMDVWGMVFKSSAGVGYLAHVSGFLTGAAMVGVLVHWRWVESDRHERNLWEVMGWREHPEDRAEREPKSGRRAVELVRNTAGLSSGEAPAWMQVKRKTGESKQKPMIPLE